MVLVSFVPDTGDDASELRLLYHVVGEEADFGHDTNVTMTGQHIGPFTTGTTVEVKTIASNSSGTRESEVQSITV